MSYEIVYNRAFIKTTRGIIPLILTGSNNCYEYTFNGRERRERDWSIFWGNKHVEISEQELLTFISDKGKENDYEFCMFRGKWVYYKDAYDFYKQGIKNAHTLEEWLNYGTYGKYGSKMGCLRCFISDWRNGKHGEKTHDKEIKTTIELEAWIDNATAMIGADENVFMCFKYPMNEPLIYHEPKDIKGQVIITYARHKGVYLAGDNTLTRDKKEAKVFNNQQEAIDYCNQNNYRFSNYKIIQFRGYQNNSKQYVVSLGHGAYFYRKTRYGMKYIYSKDSAQRMDKKKATTLIEKLTQTFKDRGYQFTMEEAI